MANDERQLPDGWTLCRLDEISEIILGQSPASETYNSDGVGLPFYQGKAEFGDLYPTPVKWCSRPKKVAEAGDILISVRAPVGPTNLAQEKSAIGRGLAALRPKNGMLSKYLLYYLRLIEREWDSKATGTTFKAITGDVLRSQQIPLAPRAEQERIVAKIEDLFTQLDAGISALERVQAGLRRYKASVLKAAVEGKLGAQNIKFTTGESGLPQGWRWVKLGDVAEVRLGRQRSPARAQGPNMRPYMRAANVTWNGIDLSDVKEMDFSPREQEIYRLRHGDILLSEASGSVSEVGKPAIWKDHLPESYLQNTLIRVRPYEDSSEYLYYHFLYDALAERFRKIAKGVGIHHLGAENLSTWIVSLPPFEEQLRIVAEVERRLSVVRQVDSIIGAALVRAARLRQAVLRSAFEGRLV